MKKFIILPALLPSLLFCTEDDGQFEQVGTQLNVPGTVQNETRSPRHEWNDKDYDGFLQEPLPPATADAPGTVTESDGDDDTYTRDLYGEQYDDQDLDDSVYDRDDSVIR